VSDGLRERERTDVARISVVPNFFLFGEAPQTVGDRFLHLESLEERSRPNDWMIRPHAHADLSHIFTLTAGSGVMNSEGHGIAFKAPCVILVPAGIVHGFSYEVETSGSVLTLSEAYFRELSGREPEFRRLFEAPRQLPLGDLSLTGYLSRLGRELVWNAPGHAAAVEGALLSILVEILRLMHFSTTESWPQSGPQARLVARFREMIEHRFRAPTPLETYAAELSVTVSRLRDACLKVAAAPPSKLIHNRILLEARRALLYSNMTVAETGYYLGFTDPAYFSRFFSKATGESPRAFRERHRDAKPQA
jgi:AraC family transcriptional regulator, transcriptional activator of pobA